ncbi:MAG TPA: histidine phosphatase family protein [Burkholderiaceae bacterium]|nr:histidine phosphatase family protein [Burkholderiaceae bacterium]HSC00656.1 histidine phosphatase family protein [Burkholderiaceae bacterium]
MGTLYLVRHGQASFGSDDYDRLSELGARQCERLGGYFRAKGVAFDGVITGTLKRHAQSHEALARGLQAGHEALAMPGLNEYDSEAIVRAIHPQPLPRARSADEVRQHFRLLRDGLIAWMEGRTQPQGMPRFADFQAGVVAALDHVRTRHDGDVLIVSSGGPIATAVAHVLGAPPQAMVELNLRMRNSALTEFAFTPKRHALVTFNTLPHLEGVDASWVTHT